jgi:hypothetical protein
VITGFGHHVAEPEPVTALYDWYLPIIRAGEEVVEMVVASQKTNPWFQSFTATHNL